MKYLFRSWKRIVLLLLDMWLICVSYFFAFFIRFDFVLTKEYFNLMVMTLPVIFIIRFSFSVFFVFIRECGDFPV